jgi:hypothetical protein
MAYKLLGYHFSVFVVHEENQTESMFQMQDIVRKLKAIRLKPGSKRNARIKKNSPVPIDEVGYEASSFLSQEDFKEKDRKR